MLEIKLLPARQGDAIWLRWGEPTESRQLLIDMGTEEVGKRLRARLLELPEVEREFELLVVTHVDRDHIGGVLTCLVDEDPIPGLDFKDVWFNGYPHLQGRSIHTGLQPMGPVQGERFSAWLKSQRWNAAFNGGPVQRLPGKPLPSLALRGDLRVTIVGPTPERLEALVPTWEEDVAEALRKGTLTEVSSGLEPMGPKDRPDLETLDDLRELADKATALDSSPANGTSISLLVEYADRRLLLAGDAFPQDLIAGLHEFQKGRPKIDAFKLPHHGSQSNVVKELVECVECDRWLFSTDGTQFRHPDPAALARVLCYSRKGRPHLGFNEPSKFNGWWDDDSWRTTFGYTTEYGSAEDGLTVTFD